MLKIYAIIVAYNGIKWYNWCLEGLKSSSIVVTPIIVDNGSTDNTIEYLQEQHPECIIIPQQKNIGFGQANNKGIEYALRHEATHVLLLNQDATIQPDTISKLIACDDGQHILTPIHLNRNGEHIDFLFQKRSILENALDSGIVEDLLIHMQLKSYYEIQYANAACWLLPCNIIKHIGGFNPLFFHYGEDGNYIQRIHYHHYGVRLVPNAFIYHDRKEHGNETAYKFEELFRKFLSVETNINLSNTERFKMGQKIALQELWYSISIHRLLFFIKEWISSVLKIYSLRNRIRYSLKKEISLTSNWLNL